MNLRPHIRRVQCFGGSVWLCVARDPSMFFGFGDSAIEAFESWRQINFPSLWQRLRGFLS